MLSTWAVHQKYDHLRPLRLNKRVRVWTQWQDVPKPGQFGKMRPGRFCPLWMRKRWMPLAENTNVRVERVQEIGTDGRIASDVLAEGIMQSEIERWKKYLHPDDAPAHIFGILWDSIYAKQGFGWDKNPWVWVVTFKVLITKAKPGKH